MSSPEWPPPGWRTAIIDGLIAREAEACVAGEDGLSLAEIAATVLDALASLVAERDEQIRRQEWERAYGWIAFDPYTFTTYCPECWTWIDRRVADG
jgi:hypothetical protein